MSAKGKGRDDDNESVTAGRATPATTVSYAIEQAEQMIKVKEPKPFSGNREAFSEYVTSVRLFIWADNKRSIQKKMFKTVPEQVAWAASYLQGNAYRSFEPYLTQYLNKGTAVECDEPVRNVFNSLPAYFKLMGQSYGDLDETRTAEQKLQALMQTGSVPQYLAKFNEYGSRVTWDDRARMSRFFNGLKPKIQSAMAVVAYPDNFDEMINLAVRLDDSFRRLEHAQEKPGKGVRNPSHKKERDPDAMDWQASGAFKKGKKGQFKKGKGKKPQGDFKCFNCGKSGHYARDCYSKPKQNGGTRAETETPNQERKPKQKKHPGRKWDEARRDPEEKIVFGMMRREVPLNISGAPIRAGIREFVGTRQQIADVIALCPLEGQEQELIYWAIIDRSLQWTPELRAATANFRLQRVAALEADPHGPRRAPRMSEDQMIWDAFTRGVETQRLELAGVTRGAHAPIPVGWQPSLPNLRRRVAAADPLERPPPPYELPICNNPQHQELEQQILRQTRDLAEAESTAENLSTALAGVSIEAGEATERASILAGQLEEASLSLVMAREEEAAMAPRVGCTICRLVTPRVQDEGTQTMEVTCWTCPPGQECTWDADYTTEAGRSAAIRHFLGQTEPCPQTDLPGRRVSRYRQGRRLNQQGYPSP
jgi:hypothetical protein